MVCVRARVEVPEAVERRELDPVERRVFALELREVVALERRVPAELERRELPEFEFVRRPGVLRVVGLLPAFELLLVAMLVPYSVPLFKDITLGSH